MNLKNRTILVTGGSRGIGLALAEELAQENLLLITGRDAESLKAVRARHPSIMTYQCDISDPNQIHALKEKIESEYPKLDILFNNAGVMQALDLNQILSDAILTKEIEINLIGVIRMVNAFLPLLKKQLEAAIVNVSSGLAYMPFPSQPIYGATKAGLHSYTLSLRSQLAKSSVKVFEVLPPVVETDMTAKVKGYSKMNAKTHAMKVIAAISKGKPEIRPGVSNFLYYAARFAPDLTLKQLSRHN